LPHPSAFQIDVAIPMSKEAAQSPKSGKTIDQTADRTAIVAARLKKLYKNSVYPVEKKYRYDYFFESPLLSDVEFDGAYSKRSLRFFCFCQMLLVLAKDLTHSCTLS
jgi:hypothetical protein